VYNGWSFAVLCVLLLGSALAHSAEAAKAAAVAARDPTQPSAYTAEISQGKEGETGPQYVLEAIVSSGESKFAIINNKRVKVGDTLGNGKVKAIDAYSVTVVGDEGEVVLHFFGRSVKEPAK